MFAGVFFYYYEMSTHNNGHSEAKIRRVENAFWRKGTC